MLSASAYERHARGPTTRARPTPLRADAVEKQEAVSAGGTWRRGRLAIRTRPVGGLRRGASPVTRLFAARAVPGSGPSAQRPGRARRGSDAGGDVTALRLRCPDSRLQSAPGFDVVSAAVLQEKAFARIRGSDPKAELQREAESVSLALA